MRQVITILLLTLIPLGIHHSQAGDVKASSKTTLNIEIVRDITYVEGFQADPIKHKLDLYLPANRNDFPVMLFIHGGGWSHGDKKFWFDLYGKLGKAFAEHGIGVAVANYRLAPKAKHPHQAQDVAHAVAWIHQNIGKFGGRADQLFLSGHSAGGHLVSLVASDPQYLREYGLDHSVIRGVISLSGVYDVRPDNLLFDKIFGKDQQTKSQASPITHVKPGLPPFLLLHGDSELPYCGTQWAGKFCEKLSEMKTDAKVLPIKQRDHMTIIAKVSQVGDPAQNAMIEFIRTK